MHTLEPVPANVGWRVIGLALLALACVGVPLGMGLAAPRTHVARHEVVLDAPRSEVYANLADLVAWQRWNPYIGTVRPIGGDRYETRPDRKTRLAYVREEAVPESRVVISLEPTPPRFGARWTFELADEGTRTRVRMREDGWTESPTMRFAMRYLIGYDVALLGVAAALEQNVAHHPAAGRAGPGTSPP